MQEVIEEKGVYAVHSSINSDKSDLVFLELNKEKIAEIYENLYGSDKEEFIKELNHPVKGKIEVYEAVCLGYISNDDVKSYFCSKCNKEYEEKPTQQIFIELPDELFPQHIGKFYLKCNHCNNYVLPYGLIKEGEKVDSKFIVNDERGLFIKKTEKDVNDGLEGLLTKANKGQNRLDTRLLKYWAQNLGLDISTRLNEIEKIREENYFKNYQKRLEDTLNNLLHQSELISHYGQIDFWGEFKEFEKYLSNLQLNKELKEKAIKLVKNIEKDYAEKIEGLKEEISLANTKTEAMRNEIESNKTQINVYKNLEDLIKSK